MRFLSAFLLIATLSVPSVVSAQNSVVLELFTSQGCSSCPPADRLVMDLADRDPHIIALGWHVDYWDYLGWKDPYSSPEHTARQAGYRDHWHLRSLYTPQVVVHGRAEMVGSNSQKVLAAIREVRSNMNMLNIAIDQSGSRVTVNIQPIAQNLPASEIMLIKVLPRVSSEILRGENAGRTIEYVNVVLDAQRLSEWNSRSAIEVRDVDLSQGSYVLLVQALDFGPILGAIELN